MSLVAEPKYTCPDSGVTFLLRPIPPLNFDDFSIAYDEAYPPPTPPLMAVKVADKVISQPNPKDEYFLAEYSRWNAKKEAAARHFLFYMGVADDPPQDYQPAKELYFRGLSAGKRKALWVTDQLTTARDIAGLMEAINSLLRVTEEGLADSKNGTPPEQAVLTSSNGQSSPTLTPSDSTTR